MWSYGPLHILVTASTLLRSTGTTMFPSVQTWCWIAGSAARGWALAGTTRGRKLQYATRTEVEIFQKGLCDNWHVNSDRVFLSSFRAGELLDGNQRATSLQVSWASGSESDPPFFRKVNLQLGYALCLLLRNKRTCNKRISIDKVTQAVTMPFLLGQPHYKKKVSKHQ